MPFPVVGSARFLDADPSFASDTARIYLKVEAPELAASFLAQLDTGAAWSVFDPQIAQTLNVQIVDEELIPLSTRFGEIRGRLGRAALRLLADDGDSLEVDATVFVSEEWPTGRNFIAYTGMLERVRFAIDPSDNVIYYGHFE